MLSSFSRPSKFLLPTLSGLLTAGALLLTVFCVQDAGCSDLGEVFSDIFSLASLDKI